MALSASEIKGLNLGGDISPEPAELFRLRLLAEEINRRHPTADMEGLEALEAGTDTQLYPHQLHAAHFAVSNPLLKGVGLFDEVGLGKTVEAAMILREMVYRGRRNILVIAGKSLCQQWREELHSRFDLGFRIVSSQSVKTMKRDGMDPFSGLRIATYHFVNNHIAEFVRTPWDAICVDEVHLLKNPQGALHQSVQRLPRQFTILLTATPLQNYLPELHTISTLIDKEALGTPFSFREQFCEDDRGLRVSNVSELKRRMSRFAIRTLRSDVPEIKFTHRIPRLFDFQLYPDELQLYESVSEYLSRPNWAFGDVAAGRFLIVMVYRKLLASSSFALRNALRKLLQRLELIAAGKKPGKFVLAEIDEGVAMDVSDAPEADGTEATSDALRKSLTEELEEVRGYVRLCESITENAKAVRLVAAMPDLLKAGDRILIFTQYRATQTYLARKLRDAGYRIVEFHGGLKGHPNPDKDERELAKRRFRDEADVMIATDAGAEGLNLQFCHVVVNYDLPWNPMKIEQRIGRAHRIGQQNDVIAANLVGRENEVEARLVQLLTDKIHLFDSVLGESDEILGAIDDGMDFERRVFEILQLCRTPQEIDAAFDDLQQEMETVIRERRVQGRSLLQGFDDRIRDHLSIAEARAKEALDRKAAQLRDLLVGSMAFYKSPIEQSDDVLIFRPPARYHLGALEPLDDEYLGTFRRDGAGADTYFNKRHPLVVTALQHHLGLGNAASVQIKYSGVHTIHGLETLVGCRGWWLTFRVSFSGLEVEDHLFSLALLQDGESWIEHDLLSENLGRLTIEQHRWDSNLPPPDSEQVASWVGRKVEQIQGDIVERNAGYYMDRRSVLDKFYGARGDGEVMAELNARREELRKQIAEKEDAIEIVAAVRDKMALTKEKDALDEELYKLENRIQAERHRNFETKREELRKLDEQQQLSSEVALVTAAQWEMV